MFIKIYYLILSLAISSFISRDNWQIMQQQFYEIKRFFLYKRQRIWVINYNRFLVIALTLLFSVLLIIFKYDFLIPLFILPVAYIYIRSSYKSEIIPLVYTKRIKRIIVINFFLTTFIYSLCFFYQSTNIYFFMLLYTFCILLGNNAINVFSYFLSLPLEMSINVHFIRKAKKKLHSIKPIVIGITGSYGKTSTKKTLSSLLSNHYHVLATPKSYNTLLGIVRTINEQLTNQHQILIIEIGVDRIGGIKKILNLIQPTHSIITSIGNQHLSTFKTIDNVLKEKFELAISTQNKGFSLINGNYPSLIQFQQVYQLLAVGSDSHNDAQYRILRSDLNGCQFEYTNQEVKMVIEQPLLSRAQVENTSLAVTLALKLGISQEKIILTCKNLKGESHRLEKKIQGNWTIIDDSYNGNEKGFEYGFQLLKMSSQKRVLITPGLIELGNQSDKINAALGNLANECADLILFIGKDKDHPFYKNIKIEKKIFPTYREGYLSLSFYQQQALTILIANDLPDIYVK